MARFFLINIFESRVYFDDLLNEIAVQVCHLGNAQHNTRLSNMLIRDFAPGPSPKRGAQSDEGPYNFLIQD
jgi:hypothetical protein